MGMKFVSSSKRMIEFRKLIQPLIWFHRDAQEKDVYEFQTNPEAKDCIFGYREDMTRYEIFCPPELREAIISVLNKAPRIWVK